jgi:hypothetical protein
VETVTTIETVRTVEMVREMVREMVSDDDLTLSGSVCGMSLI